jgi:hypothetical protein
MSQTGFANGTIIKSKWLNSVFGFGTGTIWQSNTAYEAGDVLRTVAGEILRALNNGTSGSVEPTAPGTLRGTVTDNDIVWELFGGHLHDGGSRDGSAPKVLLTSAAEVSGTLPVANQVEHVHSGAVGQFAKVDLGAAINVTGQLPVANQVEHVHSGAVGQFGKINPLDHILGENAGYIDLVFSNAYFDTEQTVRCYYRFHYAFVTGAPAIIEVSLPNFFAQAHASGTSFIATGNPFSSLAPKTSLYSPIIVVDNGLFKNGSIVITSFGAVYLNLINLTTGEAVSDEWTAGSVNKGFSGSCFSYPVFP